jgi:hypothetical protein
MTTSTGITEAGKAALIERHRDINIDLSDWWDCVYDDFIETAETKGFLICDHKAIQFSGFWSQGDGASFTALVDTDVFIKAYGLEWAYPWIMKLFDYDGSVGVHVTRNSSLYSHEHTCTARVDWHDEFHQVIDTKGDETREGILDQWDLQLQSDIDQLEKDVEQTRLELCRELYRSLEAEYEHLTSDEAVWDSIVANELDTEPTEEDDQ